MTLPIDLTEAWKVRSRTWYSTPEVHLANGAAIARVGGGRGVAETIARVPDMLRALELLLETGYFNSNAAQEAEGIARELLADIQDVWGRP